MAYYIKWNKDASDSAYEKLGMIGSQLKNYILLIAEFYRKSLEMIDREQIKNPDISYDNLKLYLNYINAAVGKPERYTEDNGLSYYNYNGKNGVLRAQVLEKVYAIRAVLGNVEQAISAFERENISLKKYMETSAKISDSFNVSDLSYEYVDGVQKMYYAEGENSGYFSEAVNSFHSSNVTSLLEKYGLSDISDVNAGSYGEPYGLDIDSN